MKRWTFVVLTICLTSMTLARAELAQTPQQQPAVAPVGGLQLDIEPRQAQVFVDGEYKGLVDDFRGYYHHLELRAGLHRVEVFAPRRWPLILDVMIVPDRTTTYRMTLLEVSSGS